MDDRRFDSARIFRPIGFDELDVVVFSVMARIGNAYKNDIIIINLWYLFIKH